MGGANRFVLRVLILCIGLSIVMTGCSAPKRAGSKSVSYAYGQAEGGESKTGQVTQLELERDLQRFIGRFSDLLRDAGQPLETSSSPVVRHQFLAQRLKWVSAALAIALGPAPEISLLDMVTFVELSRTTYKDYWMPEVFGAPGQGVTNAFDQASEEIWRITGRVLNPQQQKLLASEIQKWQAKNPNTVAVEAVRLEQFNQVLDPAEASEQSGLFASVKSATVTVDEVRLLGERALFYAQLAPFLFRMQAELGVINASGDVFGQVSEMLTKAQAQVQSDDSRQLLTATNLLLARTNEMLLSMQRLFTDVSKNPEVLKSSADMVTGVSGLAQKLIDFDSRQGPHSRIAGLVNQADFQVKQLRESILRIGLILIAAAFFAFVLGSIASRLIGAYLARRLLPPVREVQKRDKAA